MSEKQELLDKVNEGIAKLESLKKEANLIVTTKEQMRFQAACAAMTGLNANSWYIQKLDRALDSAERVRKVIAETAFKQAGALIAELEKVKDEEQL